MSLRIRQVKPDYWRDQRLADLSDTDRLVYIGLWMEADDAGWLRLNVTEIGADLYPLTARTTREKRIAGAVDELVTNGRVEVFECGHALVPNLVRHQRFASLDKRVHTVQRAHQACLATPVPQEPAVTRTFPARSGKEGRVKEREGGVSGGSAPHSMPIKINDDGSFAVTTLAAAEGKA